MLLAATLILLQFSPVSYGQTQIPDAAFPKAINPRQAAPKSVDNGSSAGAVKPAQTELSKSPDPLILQAKSLLHGGMLAAAEEAAHRYLGIHSNSADGHFLLGYILFKEVKAKESLAEYTEGAKYRKPSPLDLEVVALDYILLGDYLDADKWLTKSLEWDPRNSERWYYLGRTKYNENRLEEAINIFQQCLKLDPRNVKAEDNLGLSYAGLGRNDEAIAAYKTAIAWQEQLLEKNPSPYIDLGTLLAKQNKFEEAIPYLVQGIEISPQEAKAHEQLGKAYEHLNQLPKAQAELEAAVQLAPQSAPLHFMLGQVYRKEGLKEKAKLEFERSSALNGTHSPAENP